MKRRLLDRQVLRGLAVVALAALAGGGAAVAVCDWLVPLPDEAADIALRSEVACRDAASGRRHSAIADAGGSRQKPTARVTAHRLIGDVWTGPRRTGAFRVAGVRGDGSVEAEGVDAKTARRGLGETFRRALRKRGKAPLHERYARLAKNPFDTPEARKRRGGGSDNAEEEQKGPTIYEGDVYISGIPMVDQGSRAYCAVATAARVLQGYGIEVTMEDMAALAESSECCGTNMRKWDKAMWQVANTHGLRLVTVNEMTEEAQPLAQLIIEYNQAAHALGAEALAQSDYITRCCQNYKAFDMEREYEVQREALLSNESKDKAFNENVIARIDDSDPIMWNVLLGDVSEQTAYGDAETLEGGRGAHMRLIIGYNEQRGEVLYSDSWGEGHELKRMDACDAMSITTGMYYLSQ